MSYRLLRKRAICKAWYYDFCLKIVKKSIFRHYTVIFKGFSNEHFVPQDPLNTSFMLEIEKLKNFFLTWLGFWQQDGHHFEVEQILHKMKNFETDSDIVQSFCQNMSEMNRAK